MKALSKKQIDQAVKKILKIKANTPDQDFYQTNIGKFLEDNNYSLNYISFSLSRKELELDDQQGYPEQDLRDIIKELVKAVPLLKDFKISIETSYEEEDEDGYSETVNYTLKFKGGQVTSALKVKADKKTEITQLLKKLSASQLIEVVDSIRKTLQKDTFTGNGRTYLQVLEDLVVAKKKGTSKVGRDEDRTIQDLLARLNPSDEDKFLSFLTRASETINSSRKILASLGEDRDDVTDKLISARNLILEASDSLADAYNRLGKISSSEAEKLKTEIMSILDGEEKSIAEDLHKMIKRVKAASLPYED